MRPVIMPGRPRPALRMGSDQGLVHRMLLVHALGRQGQMRRRGRHRPNSSGERWVAPCALARSLRRKTNRSPRIRLQLAPLTG